MLIAALCFDRLIVWGAGPDYDVAMWPFYAALAGIVIVGIIVIILILWGIRKLIKHRNRRKNG